MAGKIPFSWGSQHGQNRLVAERVNPILTQPILDLAKLLYAGNALKDIRVNATADNVELYDPTAPTSVASTGAVRSSSPSAGIGYATGAGGTVTQATSKATGVTLNKVCGAVTMNAAALLAATSVSFTLTNSSIAATDVVIVNIASGATAGSYTIDVDAVAAGSCRIHVRNVSAVSLSEALVLNVAVIKSVTA